MVYKKYIAGHKFNQSPYEKARAALRKQRKKAKNKFGFDQKEMQVGFTLAIAIVHYSALVINSYIAI